MISSELGLFGFGILEGKSRGELDVIAKKLRIADFRELSTPELKGSILSMDHKRLVKSMSVTWWDRHKSPVCAFGSLILAIIVTLAAAVW